MLAPIIPPPMIIQSAASLIKKFSWHPSLAVSRASNTGPQAGLGNPIHCVNVAGHGAATLTQCIGLRRLGRQSSLISLPAKNTNCKEMEHLEYFSESPCYNF